VWGEHPIARLGYRIIDRLMTLGRCYSKPRQVRFNEASFGNDYGGPGGPP
jgi:hypothetical protein